MTSGDGAATGDRSGLVGEHAVRVTPAGAAGAAGLEPLVVDGAGNDGASLAWFDELHAVLHDSRGSDTARGSRLLVMPAEPSPGTWSGSTRREIVIDGWSVEVEIESERRAVLRERARRGGEVAGHGGPTEVRAIIPGRVLSVSVAAGDPVVAGQQLLVVEAMKMQNELRAPRDGTVAELAVGAGRTIEVGDLLLVLA